MRAPHRLFYLVLPVLLVLLLGSPLNLQADWQSQVQMGASSRHPLRNVLHYEHITNVTAFGSSQRSGQAPNGPKNQDRQDSVVEDVEDSWIVSFSAFDQQFTLVLEPNELFTPEAKIVRFSNGYQQHTTPEQVFYKGKITEYPGSWVRVSIRNGVMSGMLWTAQETYFIEHASRIAQDDSPGMIMYRLSDTVTDALLGQCALADQSIAEMVQEYLDLRGVPHPTTQLLEPELLTAGSVKEVDMAIVVDSDLFGLLQGATDAFILDTLNAISGIYEAQLMIRFRIAVLATLDATSDPFSNTTDAVTLLTEFSTYYNANNTAPSDLFFGTDLGHLFTGRMLDSNVAGIAFIGVVCDPVSGVGLSRYLADSIMQVILGAHEIGHTFEARHDGETSSICETTPLGQIMSPSLNDVDIPATFSQCSLDSIIPHRDAAACLATKTEPLPPPSPFSGWAGIPIGGATLSGPAVTIYEGEPFVVVHGTDHRIYYARQMAGTWTGWTSLPGSTFTRPSVVVYDGDVWIFVRGTDSRLYRNIMSGSTWSGWAEVPGSGLTPSGPATVIFENMLSLYVRGTDNRLYQNRWNGSIWDGWRAVPGDTFTLSAPSAAVFDSTLHLVIHRADDRIVHNLKTAAGWVGWSEVPGSGATPSEPAATVFDAKLWYFVRGVDDRIYVNTLALGSETVWSGWSEVFQHGLTLAGPGAAASPTTLYVWVRGTNSGIFFNRAQAE